MTAVRNSKTPKRDFLTMADLPADELIAVLDHATAMKNQRATGGRRKSLDGRSVALVFEKASTRTRLSFEVGVFELGGHPLVISSRDTQIGRGEPLEDTARILDLLRGLTDAGNTVIAVEHDLDVIQQADWIVELGPGAGPRGGNVVVFQGIVDALRGEFGGTEREVKARRIDRIKKGARVPDHHPALAASLAVQVGQMPRATHRPDPFRGGQSFGQGRAAGSLAHECRLHVV